MTAASPIPASGVPLLFLAAFGSGISMRAADPLLPLLAAEFGVPLGQASLVITVFSIAYGLAQLGFGPLGDRHRKYLVIALAALASCATAQLCGAAASIPLSMAWIGDVIASEQRQPVLARFLIGQILGVSATVLVGGALGLLAVALHFSRRLRLK
ncbi:putative membrane transport protein [Janthinobacterium sp. CG23_2]|nr:putative membrane transport protein [Janthinobacterium sp. CG23_2]CUU26476.1 putative membrane transport protein [Janthinobacterium sp. CG23_2]